jgi:hypothetical protein
MEINFLKGKKETPAAAKQPERKFAIEYRKPPLAPAKPLPAAIKKVSWWKKLFAPKPSKPKVAQKPLPPSPPPAPKLAAIEKPKIKIAQKKEAGVYLPPSMPKEDAATHGPNRRDLEKMKKGEYAASFLDVNLIPRELAEKMRPLTKIRRLLWTAVLSWLVIFAIYGGMIWYQGYLISNVRNAQARIEEIDIEIESYKPWQEEALAFNNKATDISRILDQHIYWTAFFAFLEANTLPEVRYQNLSGDVAGTFTLSATAPNYETVAKQIALFKSSELVSDISVASAVASLSEDSSEVKFNISLTVKPDVFYKKNEL